MVFSLGEIINRSAETFYSSGVVNTLSSNIFIATAIMLIIILIIIIAVVNHKIERKRIIKLLLYMGASIMLILTIHYYALSARLKRDYQKETNRVIYDKINDINSIKRIPVVPNISMDNTPFRFPDKEPFRQGFESTNRDRNTDQEKQNIDGGREDNVEYQDDRGEIKSDRTAEDVVDLSRLGLNTIELPD